jgi:hypothetical protein
MGKIILEFDSVEESEEAKTAVQAGDWKQAVESIDILLRKTVRHRRGILNPTVEATDIEVDMAERMREEIREILNDNDLTL